MKRKLPLLITSLLSILLLGGCTGEGGGGIDFVKLTQNPFVVIVGALVIAFWMFGRSK